MDAKKLEGQLDGLREELSEVESKLDQAKLEHKRLIYLARAEKDPEAQGSLSSNWAKHQKFIEEKEELEVAISEAENRLKAAQANQRRVEIRGQQEGLKIKVNEWLKLSKEVERTINRLVNQAKRYNKTRGEVFAAALPLSGRQLALERKSTIANHIHLKLSRIDPFNFAFLSQKLARGLSAMDIEIAQALMNKSIEAIQRLDDELEDNLAEHLIDKKAKVVV